MNIENQLQYLKEVSEKETVRLITEHAFRNAGWGEFSLQAPDFKESFLLSAEKYFHKQHADMPLAIKAEMDKLIAFLWDHNIAMNQISVSEIAAAIASQIIESKTI